MRFLPAAGLIVLLLWAGLSPAQESIRETSQENLRETFQETFQAAMPAQPDTGIINTRLAWEKVAAARDAAAADRHHDAVADYLDALANDASLVPRVAQEIAYQKLWREDADKAIFYFRRYLARHPQGSNRSVRNGLAMAYSWSGRQPEAIALYRDLVQEDRADGAARLGLGRSLLWNNNLRAGMNVVRGVEDEFPADSRPGRQASHFLLTVLDGYTPHLMLKARGTWESDGLDTYRLGPEMHLEVLGNMLLQVAPSASLFQMPEQPNVFAQRFQLGLIGPLAHNWNLHAYGWLEHFRSRDPIESGAAEDLKWTRPGGDLWLTWLAHPKVRLDFGGASQPVLTYQAFAKELGYIQGSVSSDWRFARHFSLGASGIYGDYSDDNTKWQGKASLYWRRGGKVQILTGPVLTYMDFAGISGHWGRRFADEWLVALEAGHGRSRFDSAGGYHRTFVELSLRAMF